MLSDNAAHKAPPDDVSEKARAVVSVKGDVLGNTVPGEDVAEEEVAEDVPAPDETPPPETPPPEEIALPDEIATPADSLHADVKLDDVPPAGFPREDPPTATGPDDVVPAKVRASLDRIAIAPLSSFPVAWCVSTIIIKTPQPHQSHRPSA